MSETCSLCGSEQAKFFHKGGKASQFREFYHCETCGLVFVPRQFHLSTEDEKAYYLQHNNDPKDQDYRKFLGRLYYALKPHLKVGSKGLDFGSGPGPALAAMMLEDGFDVHTYDPYFSPDENVLKESYDFVTCTETAEHLANPASVFQTLDGLIRRPGWLGIMTSMLDSWDDFPNWHYHRDPTHVAFYSRRTMHWIANRFDWEILFPREHVTLFRKL